MTERRHRHNQPAIRYGQTYRRAEHGPLESAPRSRYSRDRTVWPGTFWNRHQRRRNAKLARTLRSNANRWRIGFESGARPTKTTR